ncbi:MAG: hypothetical protein IKH30_14790 [Clostridia bacterium]|nr:hypothetical protein [Clostridia bacterium]
MRQKGISEQLIHAMSYENPAKIFA